MVLEEAQRDQLVMTSLRTSLSFRFAVIALFVCSTVERASACAVCFGDPDSRMAKGVVAGVLVLVGVIGMVLVGMTAIGVWWVLRSRRLTRDSLEVIPGGTA